MARATLVGALLTAALAGAVVAAPAAHTAQAPRASLPGGTPTPPGAMAVRPDLPEPTAAQFDRANPYVAPTEAPADDIGHRRLRVQSAGTYTCSGFGSIDDPNLLSGLMRDTFTWGGFAPYQVGDGTGDVNWRANPYTNPSWYMWLHSLRWLGQGITAGAAGDAAALQRVATITSDWVRDNPHSWKGDVGAWESTMHRTNVLICLRHAVLAAHGTTSLPPTYAWLDATLHDHARFLIDNWSGAWNHGTDESIALFGVGCLLGRSDYRSLAQDRLAQSITTAIDPQGSTNEQATSYAQFNYALWGRAEEVLRACNVDPGTTIAQRRARLAVWLAHATNSLGRLHQIGDSEVVRTVGYRRTPMEYAATLGATGRPPWQPVAIYQRGYVFGRSGWGLARRSFAQESTYSIRYGDPRARHGHNDHMSITYTAQGRDVIIDGGHAGYQPDAWRAWAKSDDAHSALVTPLTPEATPRTALQRSVVRDTWQFFEFGDAPASGITRTRGVLVLEGPDLLVTLDRATSLTDQRFQTLWHLPSNQRATIQSRTTAVATTPDDQRRTILLQIPYRQSLPPGALLVKQAQTDPIQGWHYPDIRTRDAAPTVVLTRSGRSASILSVVAPVSGTAGVQYTTRTSGTSTIVDLDVAGQRVSILIDGGGAMARL